MFVCSRYINNSLRLILGQTDTSSLLWKYHIKVLLWGDVDLADSAAMLTRREASTPRPSPRCTCLPPRQHCVEVALGGKQVHLGFASEYLLSSSCNFNSSPPRPRPSSPRLRLGELGLGLGGLERSQWVGTSCNFSSSPPRQVQVHLGCASVNLALTRGT